jgi:hypothetical protein
MKLQDWKNYADMPTRDSQGKYFDLEDGIYFEDKSNKNVKIKSELRKEKEKELSKKKKDLKKFVEDFQKRDWKTIPIEEKNIFYKVKREYEEILKTKVSFELVKLDLKNTFKFKDIIKANGGKWDIENKLWLVPCDILSYLEKIISQ